jgi:hypothetical protein
MKVRTNANCVRSASFPRVMFVRIATGSFPLDRFQR